MPSLNPFRRQQPDRPSLRERAADLKASLSRAVQQPEPQAAAEAAAEAVDWDSPPPGFMAYPEREPMSFINIPEGLRLELERLHDIADDEFERRAKAAEQRTREALRTGFENRLRRQLRLDEIQAALSPERPVSAGTEAEGTIFYEDAAGNTRRAPVAEWINFTAMRLYTVARQELSRRFTAECGSLDEAGNRTLDAKLRRELRTDALFALAFRSHNVFEAAQIKRHGTDEEIAAARAEGSPDPIFAAMQAAHYAKLAHDQFEERIKGTVSNPADREEEQRLMDADSRALAAVYATTPTSRYGQLALLHWIREQISNAGCFDGEPADGHESVWADGYRALEAALLAPPTDRGNLARKQADEVDLSGCSIRVLARLCEKFTAPADMWSDMSCLPFVEADEAAARVVDEEYVRAGHVRDRIIGLLRNYRPKDDDERDEILGARLRYEMDCEGAIRDAVLLADLTAAWRA
ncbi:hypothetical protein [Methylobacterium sp. E-046]|uniref:hypothetical protein n=1 Tax=Methylobacterium sp. E-046 TaxID=2836576 RepID=UPI001FB8C89F|nr:hypothetical protein [Methylobacterium sp. E-046]MCJ2101848.1 hypothetical protein [Methylobacterium sp. E-046]